MQSNASRPDFDPVRVAEEYLALVPSHRRYAPVLIELATVAWDGTWPGYFYQNIASFLGGLPWLADRWIDSEALLALRMPELPDDSFSKAVGWEAPTGTWRRRTSFRQFEGLVLLAALEECDAARAQLARALDLIADGLTSNRRGTAKRAKRRHPLKELLFEPQSPQSMAAMAKALSRVIPKICVLYPKFGQFLAGAIWPLVTGRAPDWSPSTSADDLLDLDADECSDNVVADIPELEFQPQKLRAFTAEDLVEELDALVRLSETQRVAAAALTSVWRGEDTWDFFQSLYRISHVAAWLRPFIQQRADLPALQSLSQSIHSTRELYARQRAAKWRERRGIEPAAGNPPKALVAPSDQNRRQGIFHLRGLLVYGRLHGVANADPRADHELSQLVSEMQRAAARPLSDEEIAWGFQPQHALEPILDRIGTPRSSGELHSALRELLPEISAAHPVAGRLVGEVYLALLTDQPPTERKASDRKSSRMPRTGLKTRRVRVPTREQVLPGEPKEEAEPGVVAYRRSGASKPRTTIKEEIQWVNQRIWGSNPLLIRNHIESLSDAEMALVVQSIERRIQAALEAKQFESARIAIVATLIALTGRGPSSFAQTDSRLGDRREGEARPRLWLKEGAFELPILRPEDAFQATTAITHLLEKTATTMRLSLPPKLCGWINALLEQSDVTWRWEPELLRTALNAFVGDVEEDIGSGITLARLRNFARARLRDVTQDTSKTMLLCGDTFGLSTASLYYMNVPLRELEASFQAAMWPVLGDQIASPPYSGGDPIRVGSQLLITMETARDLARSPSAPMNASGKQRIEGRRRIQDHNALTDHVLCMLMAAGGHRPTAALLRLGRFDFDLHQPAAIFSDKQCDAAHSYRYAPTADLIAEQVAQYLNNLRALAQDPCGGSQTAQRATKSLHGAASLFFHLAPDGSPIELDLASWRETLPGNWGALPLNWGRTWLASRGRDAGFEADHLAIVLGHLEATGYPFSRESPLEPAQLSRKVSGPLGSMARSAGWVLRKGFGKDATIEELLLELGPLRDWKREHQELASQMREFQIEANQARRSQLLSKREEGERLAHSILSKAIPCGIPSFGDLVKLAPSVPAGDTPPDERGPGIKLSWEEMKNVEQSIEDAAASDKAMAIAGHNALHRYIKCAVNRLQWDCPIPSPWLAPPTQEPTPFFSGMFRATAQLCLLRENFGRIPPRPGVDAVFTDFEWACGISVMALCIFSFEADASRLRNILAGRMSMTSSTTIEDLLLLETDDRARSAGVRKIAAAALGRLRRDHPSDELPAPEKLDEVLAALMPRALAGPAAGLMDRLCATIEITNRVELSGLARLANDVPSGCVSMPVARQRQFLEEGWGSVDAVPVPSQRASEQRQIGGRKCKPSEARKNYRRLRRVLHIGTGPKTFALTGESLSQANIGAFRGPLQRELEALLSEQKLSSLVACIAAYALNLTVNGTAGKKDPAWSTVYKYITSFGAELVEQGSDVDFLDLDADQYLDLYQDVIDRKNAASCKEIAARELAGFHDYLRENHGFDAVDFSDLEGVVIAADHQVDADVVQPQEISRGLTHMSALAVSTEKELPADPVRTRLDRQALVFTLLLRASGARLNEIAALRFKDVLANPESTLLFVRPSRYRRLKTAAARRIISASKRLSRSQRQVVCDWLAAEKARLGKSWKSTLPIFGADGEPKVRVAPKNLRDKALEALAAVMGNRSRVHRVRHLVAGEDLAALWLSDQDCRAIRRSRVRARRFGFGQNGMDVALPRHIREQGISFGHRRSSTTVLNYFHMSWMTKSRAVAALHPYETRHAAAVALGVSVAGADKILQRKKPTTGGSTSAEPISVWVMHAAGDQTATPGNKSAQTPEASSNEGGRPASARLVSRMLRDIQRGLSPAQAVLAYGLNQQQADRLTDGIREIERRTAFRLMPHSGPKGRPRAAREFGSARPTERIIDLLDEGSVDEKELVRDLAHCYLSWARRSKRDELIWPTREVDRMAGLLHNAGVAESQIQRSQEPGEAGFEKLVVLRHVGRKATMNHGIAWALIVVRATLILR